MAYEVRLPLPPIQYQITTTNTDWDIFSDTKIAAKLSTLGMDTTILANESRTMNITFLPDSACTVIINGNEYDSPSFYETNGFVPIKSFKIKENGISGLVVITIA